MYACVHIWIRQDIQSSSIFVGYLFSVLKCGTCWLAIPTVVSEIVVKNGCWWNPTICQNFSISLFLKNFSISLFFTNFSISLFFQKYQVWLDLDWIGADDLWIIILKLKCLIVLLIKTCLSKYFESSKNRKNWENSNSRISRSQVPNWVSSSSSIKSELAYQFFENATKKHLTKVLRL